MAESNKNADSISSKTSKTIGINKSVSGDWDLSASHKINFNDKDDNYGKPPEGSLTEARAEKASKHINKEVLTLISVIRGIGNKDETDPNIVRVKFGKLFEYYTTISNKVVGILLRARRWKLVDFSGEMLYQRQDDDKTITLLVGPDTVPTIREYSYYGQQNVNSNNKETLKDKLLKLNTTKEECKS